MDIAGSEPSAVVLSLATNLANRMGLLLDITLATVGRLMVGWPASR